MLWSQTPAAGAHDVSSDEASGEVRTPPRHDLLRVLRSRRAGGVPRLASEGSIQSRGGVRSRIAGALGAMAAAHRRIARELEAVAEEVGGGRRRTGPRTPDRALDGRVAALLDGAADPLSALELSPPDLAPGLAFDGVPEAAATVTAMIRRIAALAQEKAELERRVGEGRAALLRSERRLATERREAGEREARLIREVDHRTRNALAVVHAIVSLTRVPDIEAFTAAVERRVQALARAHGLLSDACWRGARLGDLVTGEFRALGGGHAGRVAMSGAAVTLDPPTVLALALALHELAANAARHGALSHPEGHLEVGWQQRGDDLVLTWNESGRTADAAVTEGLGLRIVRASVESQLCGRIALDWRPGGLSCAITLPGRDPPQPVAAGEVRAGRHRDRHYGPRRAVSR